MTEEFELANPDRVTIGTVGPVGERVFLLQVREGAHLQDAQGRKGPGVALARFLGRMLAELERPGELPSGDELALEPFGEPDFVVRSLGVSYDDDLDRIILVADEIDRTEAGDRGRSPFRSCGGIRARGGRGRGESVRLAMTREQAAALAIRGTELVEAGRPLARFAGIRSTREATCARGRTATARR